MFPTVRTSVYCFYLFLTYTFACPIVWYTLVLYSVHNTRYYIIYHYIPLQTAARAKRFSSGYLKLSFPEGLLCIYSIGEKLCRHCVSSTYLPRFDKFRLHI
jgi:hypothetical protein